MFGLLAAMSQAGLSADSSPFDVRNYGAAGDGRALDTAALQKAVDACAAGGGGTVRIPAGRYLTGPVFLRSCVQVEIEAGAVLLGSTNFSDYPAIDGRWEGHRAQGLCVAVHRARPSPGLHHRARSH